MQNLTISITDDKRRKLLRKGVLLEIATVSWNLLEAFVAIGSGLTAGSIALIGFGVDSLIETISAAVVGWRLQTEYGGASASAVDRAEKTTSKVAGYLLFLLAAYVLFDSIRHLLGYTEHSHESALGIFITVAALIVMPLLAASKLKIAREINSKALKADALESSCCAWFAFATLAGLALNATLHWWWADSLAGLILVPLMVREGIEAVKNEDCGCHKGCESQV